MFHSQKKFNRILRLSLFLCVWFAAVGFTGPNMALAAAPAPVDLLSAGDFVILGETAITTTGATSIVGDIGISPHAASYLTGFGQAMDSSNTFATSALVTGKIYAADYAAPTPSKMTTAISDMLTAYNNAAGRAPDYTELYDGDISGRTLATGVYKWSTGVLINTDVTLSGSASDVWIFQMAGDLTIASNVKVLLTGGARASNVFWQVGGGTGATLGTYSTFNGTILSAKQIIVQTGAVLNGRALAQTQVTLEANTVTFPCPLITLLPTVLPAGTVNSAYSQTITASGGDGPYTFTLTSGTLPTELSPINTGGVIAGTPTAAGTFIFTITATDDNGCKGLREYTLVINPEACPVITLLPTVLLPGIMNTLYSQNITANPAGTYTFTMTAGTLPAGLSPITSGGVIAGTPTVAGTFTFTITATDTTSGCTGLREYTLVINPADCPPITLLPTVLPAGTINTPYSRTIAASPAGTYTFTMTSGSLPAGLSPITNGGVIAGTPTEAGTFTFTITATDTTSGCTGLWEYIIVINPTLVGTIPTLSEWGMIIFMTLLGLISIYYLRRRKVKV